MKEMKKHQNRITALIIATLLIITIGASTTLIPNAKAHTPIWNIPTYAYINVSPNPDGVGQSLIVYMWLDSVYGAAGGSTAAIPTNGATASAALISNNWRFHNFQLTITPPNGSPTTTTFPVISDTTSSQSMSFTPSVVGTYTFNFTFPGQVYGANGDGYTGSSIFNDTYLASSALTTLVVQQEPIVASIGSTPLPTAYWTTPIYGKNSNWYTVSSNWLGSGSPILAGYTSSTLYHPDALGPMTSHIMWTSQLQFGGVVGGNMYPTGGSDPNGAGYGVSYFEGSSYQPRFANPIIVDGYLYYTQPVSYTGPSSGPTVCVNLQTGQTLWSSTAVPSLSFAYIYNLWDPDQHGTFAPILFTSNFARAFDAYTGRALFNVTGVPTGTSVAGPSGEQIKYVMTNQGTTANPNWYMSEWNSSKLWQYDVNPYTGGGSLSPAIINASNGLLIATLPVPIAGATGTLPPGAPTGTSNVVPYNSNIVVNANIPKNSAALATGSTTTPLNQVNYDSLTTYDWNISIPWHNTIASTVTVIAADFGDLMLCRSGSLPSGFPASSGSAPYSGPWTLFAVNLNASVGSIGTVLWTKTYDPPSGNLTLQLPNVDFQTRTFVYQYYETMQWVGYSLTNGNYLYTTQAEVPFNYYDWSGYNPGVMAYGNLYSGGFGGVTYCFNDKTGNVVWTWGNGQPGSGNSTFAGLDTPYGVYPTFVQSISNGVVYSATDEHTIPDPLYKGATYQAINATTGKLIWQLSGYPSEWATSGSEWATANGYLTCMNGYNNQVYSIGKGPSATSIQAPQTAVTAGSKVIIQGTVMDISAGTKQDQQAADFPNGVPVASDSSMMAWMGYVYQQQAEPINFTGVTVTLTAIDPNGNLITLGNATTDATGHFISAWQAPQVPGEYSVTATFAGTNGYWGSSEETGMVVQNAAATPPPTASPLTNLATMSDITFGITAAVITIIVAIAIVGVLLLRKKP